MNNIQSNLEAIWNLVEINGKQILMGNVYIPPDSKMLHKFELEPEKCNDFPLLLLAEFNTRPPIWDKNCKAPKKSDEISHDIMSRHNVQIQNDQNSRYIHVKDFDLFEE